MRAFWCVLSHFSCVWLFASLWAIACQASLSWRFSRQESWSGLPCPSSGDPPDPGIEPMSLKSPVLAGKLFTTSATWRSVLPKSGCNGTAANFQSSYMHWIDSTAVPLTTGPWEQGLSLTPTGFQGVHSLFCSIARRGSGLIVFEVQEARGSQSEGETQNMGS